MGYGTPGRSELGLNRWCGLSTPLPCIGGIGSLNGSSNATEYNFTIPSAVTDRFTRGLDDLDGSVSSVFDIEWRTYSSDTTDNGTRFQIGAYRRLQTLILEDAVNVVEGLIVDTHNGGIGLRNHSVPPTHLYGSAWSEDILFLEPQTSCVDTNLTLEFNARHGLFSSLFSEDAEDLALVDRGGFTALSRVPPVLADDIAVENGLGLDLSARAYTAAWFNNLYTMGFLNVTDPDPGGELQHVESHLGRRFPLDEAYSPFTARDSFNTKLSLGLHLGQLPSRLLNGSLPLGMNTTLTAANYTNPYNVAQDDFDDALTACKGATGRTIANTSVVAITCGMVFGTPRRTDGTQAFLFNPGDELMMPIYTCASATRASLKTVHFNYNGTGQLAGLSVDRIEEKAYNNDNSKPLWGVEITNLTLFDANPLWGFIQPSDADRPDLVSLRQESLLLPGFQRLLYGGAYSNLQNLPGVDFHVHAMSMAYDISPASLSDLYSGVADLGVFARWQDLSRAADTTGKILDLVWTDVAANAIIGTRGWHTHTHTEGPLSSEAGTVVRRFNRRVRYRWLYGIPAYLVLACTAGTAVVSVLFYVTGRATSATVRWYLNATSTGRVYGVLKTQDMAPVQLPTDEWVREVGVERLTIGR
ncbi:hypothetical protein BDW62DRAFT_195508 [Aspergillus aurantiobrunneus]